MNANKNAPGFVQKVERVIGSWFVSRKNKIPMPAETRNPGTISREQYNARMQEDVMLLGLCAVTLFVLYYTYSFVNGIWMP